MLPSNTLGAARRSSCEWCCDGSSCCGAGRRACPSCICMASEGYGAAVLSTPPKAAGAPEGLAEASSAEASLLASICSAGWAT